MTANHLKIVFISWKVAYNFVEETTFPTAELNKRKNEICNASAYDSEDSKDSNLTSNFFLECMAGFTRVSTYSAISVQFVLEGSVLRWDRNCG